MRNPLLPGVTVTIRVDRKDSIEYNTTFDDHSPTTSAYIECSSGAFFSVEVALDADFAHHASALLITTELDGVTIRRHVERGRRSKEAHTVSTLGSIAIANGATTLQRCTFADLATSDAAPKKEDFQSLKQIGEVTLTIQRCHIVSRRAATEDKPILSSAMSVPEKALKGRAISNRTKLAAPEKTAAYNHVQLTYPYGEAPLAVFTFLYRTHRDLQTEGIIPRSPSPTPLEDREHSTLSHEEALELLQRLKTREAEALKNKLKMKLEKAAKRGHAVISDATNDEDDDEVVVAGESNGSKRAKHAEIIDLSD